MTSFSITGMKAAPGSMPVISFVPALFRSAMLVMPLHVVQHRDAVLGLALVPRRTQELHLGLDLGLFR